MKKKKEKRKKQTLNNKIQRISDKKQDFVLWANQFSNLQMLLFGVHFKP